MYTKQEIFLQHFREGKSQRKISQELGISRMTVKKYLDQISDEDKNSEAHKQALSKSLREPPGYDSSKRSKLRLTLEVQEFIDGFLRENEKKLDTGLHKQILKKADILDALHAQDY